jgi:predicted nucleotidyltransferase
MAELQRAILEECAEWVEPHPCVKAVYVFGSIARGDYRADSDVDIYVETAITGHEMVQDFTDFHEGADGFAILLGGKIGRDVHVHGMVLSEPTDHAWPAIQAASRTPVAQLGKAMLSATPKIKSHGAAQHGLID